MTAPPSTNPYLIRTYLDGITLTGYAPDASTAYDVTQRVALRYSARRPCWQLDPSVVPAQQVDVVQVRRDPTSPVHRTALKVGQVVESEITTCCGEPVTLGGAVEFLDEWEHSGIPCPLCHTVLRGQS